MIRVHTWTMTIEHVGDRVGTRLMRFSCLETWEQGFELLIISWMWNVKVILYPFQTHSNALYSQLYFSLWCRTIVGSVCNLCHTETEMGPPTESSSCHCFLAVEICHFKGAETMNTSDIYEFKGPERLIWVSSDFFYKFVFLFHYGKLSIHWK